MALPMNSYLTPEQAAAMAAIEDPKDRMNTFGGMQQYATQLPMMNQIRERNNGRVVGRTSAMEGLGQMGSQIAGAYMQKQLMDKYGSIMDANNKSRQAVALQLARAAALRGAGQPGAANVPGVGMPGGPSSMITDPNEIDSIYGN